MLKWGMAMVAAIGLAACEGGGGFLPEGAVELPENRVNSFRAPSGAFYDMRTYVVPLQQPYYITVRSARRTLSFERDGRSAGAAAAAYIQTRGCTGPLSRLSSQDKYDSANKVWTIVISC
ncbi:MAG: hypothetical protein AAFQ09_02440 [Pseudomonadota bacterium]